LYPHSCAHFRAGLSRTLLIFKSSAVKVWIEVKWTQQGVNWSELNKKVWSEVGGVIEFHKLSFCSEFFVSKSEFNGFVVNFEF